MTGLRPIVILLVAVGASIVLAPFTDAQTTTIGHATVKDGDDLIVGGIDHRLAGIDAFELDQRCTDAAGHIYNCGSLAADVLAEETAGAIVTCTGTGRDFRRKRTLAVCTAMGRDLALVMVQRGYALAYRRYSDKYVAAEREAQAAKRGAWAGTFIEPETWRRMRRPRR